MTRTLAQNGNRILASLSADDLAAIKPKLEPVTLPLRQVLSEAGQQLTHAYFLNSGIASVLIGPERTTGVEVGVVGSEGFYGIPIVLGAGQTPHHCFMQGEGTGWKIAAPDLTQAIETTAGFRAILLKYVHCFMTQLAGTAYANADFTVEERLARWLLICHDRLGGDEMLITHEFLALMLGVRRPGVTVATHVLEGEGMIRAKRGRITILNRARLEEVAGASYGVSEDEYARLFGSPLRNDGTGGGTGDLPRSLLDTLSERKS